jgi:16S rRNA processing protein RimM
VPSAVPAPGNIVVMGQILVPYGVRGWVKVRPLTETPGALLDHATWWVRPARGSTWREMLRIAGRMHSGALLAEFAGVGTREAALALKGCDVGVPRAALPAAPKGEIYWADLVGLAVVNREGVPLGEVCGVTAHGAHPLLRVARPAAAPGPERLIPYVPAIVDRVDPEAKRIVVDWGDDY